MVESDSRNFWIKSISGRNCTMIGIHEGVVGAIGADAAATPGDEEELLLDDDPAPPPPAPLRRELTDAVEDAMAEARTAPNPVVSDAVARRFSSHSEI